MIYFTSDCHFNHKRILEFEPKSRDFDSIEEMNRQLIQNWNNVVTDEDDIYVIGDFFLGSPEDVDPILNQLHGHIHLIRGNHDSKAKLELYKDRGISVQEIGYVEYKGLFFILCHFPIVSDEWMKMICGENAETVLLYGHIHSQAPEGLVDNTFHIGVDTNNLTPVSAEYIFQEYQKVHNS